MKTSKIILILIVAFFSANTIFSQNNQSEVQNQLDTIFKLCKSKSYKKTASLLLYSGKDSKKKYKSSFNANIKSELNSVKRICKKIKAYFDISDSFTYGKLNKTQKDNQTWYVQQVLFKSGKQHLSANFSFLKVGKTYLLGKVE